MASSDSLFTRSLAARGTAGYIVTDAPVPIRLRYVGTGTVTSVTVTTATNIVMVTSDGGTDTYAFATYNTVAKLIAAINADAIFEAKVLDGLLSDATASVFVDGAITAGTDAFGVTTWDVLADTSAAKKFTYTLTGNRDWDTRYKNQGATHRVHLQEVKYNVTLGGAGANLVNIYLRTRGGTETTLWSGTSVSASATTINFAAGLGKITSPEGGEIIVRISDGTSIADAAGNYMQVTGIVE